MSNKIKYVFAMCSGLWATTISFIFIFGYFLFEPVFTEVAIGAMKNPSWYFNVMLVFYFVIAGTLITVGCFLIGAFVIEILGELTD